MLVNVESAHLWLAVRRRPLGPRRARRGPARRQPGAPRDRAPGRARPSHHCIRACGARSLVRPSPIERILRDLTFYLRHDNDDHILATIGRAPLGRGPRPVVLQALTAATGAPKRASPRRRPGHRCRRWCRPLGLLACRPPYLTRLPAALRRGGHAADAVRTAASWSSSTRSSSPSCFRAPPESRLRRGRQRRLRAAARELARCCCSTAPSTCASAACCCRRFHGERMRAYELAIRDAADRAIDSWPVGEPFALAALDARADARRDHARGVRGRRRPPAAPSSSAACGECSRRRPGAASSATAGASARSSAPRSPAAAAATDLDRRADVLSTLLAAGPGRRGQAMSDDELHDELITLLVAGHETTASALGWAFELILGDPRVLDRLRQALAAGDARLPRRGDQGDAAAAPGGHRPRPARRATARCASAATGCEPGIEVTPSIEAIHADPATYPDPASFRPERFLNGDGPDARGLAAVRRRDAGAASAPASRRSRCGS